MLRSLRVHSPFQNVLILPLADSIFKTYQQVKKPLVNVGDLESITMALWGELGCPVQGTFESQLPQLINGNDDTGKGSPSRSVTLSAT